MESLLTVQQAAAETGLSGHTLRYYERIGLIERVNRAGNGHRRYADHDLDSIELYKCLRASGMSIERMKQFSTLVRSGDDTLGARLELLAEHRRAVLDGIEELKRCLEVIEDKIDCYTTTQEEAL